MSRWAAALLALLPLVAVAQPAPQPAAPETAPQAEPPLPPPNVWHARPVADLIALDKVSARPTTLKVRVGESTTFGSLAIAVGGCVVRPPDQPADAAAFLDIVDTMSGKPLFHGWLILSSPSLSMLQHPIYDVRVAGCQG